MMMDHVHISKGISKLTSGNVTIPSVNLLPIDTCRHDAPCFNGCYACKGRFMFNRNRLLLSTNTELWHNEPEGFERDVSIAAFHSRFFRWHSAGDIPDASYFAMMVRVAQKLPDTKFLCFTKKDYIVNQYLGSGKQIPLNLTVVLSAWGKWIPENPHNLPVAYIRFKKKESGAIPETARECPKHCGDCTMTGCSCWDLKAGESVVFDEH